MLQDLKQLYDSGIMRPQSKFEILEASFNILKLFKPKSILEIGLGKGDWVLLAGLVLDNPEARFYGIDNFSQIPTGKQLNTEESDWPDNVDSLCNYIEEKKSQFNIKGNYVAVGGDVEKNLVSLLKSLNTKFDCIRIDCLCQNKEPVIDVIEKCLEYTTPEFLLLVDDIGPNQCSNRFLACADLVEQDKIKPLWFSSDEAAYTNIEFDSSQFIKDFDNLSVESSYKIRPPVYFTYSNHRKVIDFIRTI